MKIGMYSILLLIAAGICCSWQSLPESKLGGAREHPLHAWSARLESLRPSEPLEYFDLGEEVADASSEKPHKELARHLFALAGVLDPDRLGRSACLAMADLEEHEPAKRRLLALAALLDNKSQGTALHGGDEIQSGRSSGSNRSNVSPTAVLAVTEALSRYRRGQGVMALSALRKPGATELLQRYERMLPPGGHAGGSGKLNRLIEDCKLYKGQQKPALSASDVTQMLQLELGLLSGAERSWSSELAMSAGEPLIEADPTRLAESFGVDATKPYYRHHHWVER